MFSIIGGGPAGAYSAYLLAKTGYDVDIYEEDSKIGSPVRCTGIVTSKIKEILTLKPDIIVNKINTIKITAPNQQSTKIKLKQPDLIINRTKFDQYLIDKAIQQGAGLFHNHRLTAIQDQKLKFSIKGQTHYVNHNKYIIGADGPLSVVGKSINSNIKNFFIGSQVIVKGEFNKNQVETFLFQKGFGWVVPENENLARIGLFTYKNAGSKLTQLLNTKYPKVKILQKQGGLIPIYDPKLKTHHNQTYLIGDAAGMVKATTGGGIVQSLIAAQQLAKSIKTKQNYETLWKRTLSKSLKLHLFTRKILDKFNDNDLNKLITLTAQEKIQLILGQHNRDNNIKLGIHLLKTEPRYLLFLSTLLRPS